MRFAHSRPETDIRNVPRFLNGKTVKLQIYYAGCADDCSVAETDDFVFLVQKIDKGTSTVVVVVCVPH